MRYGPLSRMIHAPKSLLAETAMTTTAGHQIVPHQSASLPELRAADRGVASSLESVISKNTRRVYGTQWRLFDRWCADVGLTSRPGRSPHRGPLPGAARQFRRHHRHSAPYRVTKEGIDLRIAT